ncbi:MAG: FAD-dependent oxidoreductase [Thermodesulfobacteriota bacterium]
MGKRLVLVGGGHAHMMTLANLGSFLQKGHAVTVIQPSEFHYYSGMGPGMLGGFYRPADIRFATRHVVEKQGGRFVLGRVVRIEAAQRKVVLADGSTIGYDVLSCNAGSYVPQAAVKGGMEGIFAVKPIERLMAAQTRLLELADRGSFSVAIIGGGPSAVEVAGNVWRLLHDHDRQMADIRIFAGRKLMARFPESVRRRAFRSLQGRGIHILEQGYVREVAGGKVTLESGEQHEADFIFLSVGVKPSAIFQESGLPIGPDGGLLVNRYLQCPEFPEIFGGGDCIYFQDQPLDKVGVYAVRQNPVLLNNLLAALDGGRLLPFTPGGDYLLIFNLGDGTGILRKRWLEFDGRLAFLIKDYIDRRFMKKFQAIE